MINDGWWCLVNSLEDSRVKLKLCGVIVVTRPIRWWRTPWARDSGCWTPWQVVNTHSMVVSLHPMFFVFCFRGHDWFTLSQTLHLEGMLCKTNPRPFRWTGPSRQGEPSAHMEQYVVTVRLRNDYTLCNEPLLIRCNQHVWPCMPNDG